MQTPAKKQRIKISKNPLSFRPRAKKARIVVDGNDPDRHWVGVTICEIPKGLLKDLKDDIEGASDELTANTEEETGLRLGFTKALKDAKESGVSAEYLFEIKQGLKATLQKEIEVLNQRRKELRAEQTIAQMAVIRWGVCDHDAENFDLTDELDDDDLVDEPAAKPFDFERGSEAFDGVNYLVAGPVVIEAYKSIGQPFLDALFYAIVAWQDGKYVDPEKVWSTTKDLNELNKRLVEARVKKAIEASGLTKEEATELYEQSEGVESSPLDLPPETPT